MQKLKDYTELKKGVVYNSVYIGENEAYARINGKATFLVLATKPKLLVQTLYDQFGDPNTEHITRETVAHSMPELTFKEYELFRPTNESEWFKKSVKFSSLSVPLEKKLIKLSDIEKMVQWRKHGPVCPFTSTHDRVGRLKGVQCDFQVEDETEYPLLQTVFVVWPTWDDLFADFKKLGFTVRT